MKVLPRPDSWWRRFDGPFTAELKLVPTGFGLGRLPARLQPDALTRTVCGFCSTGCSLDIHRRQGKVVNLTPTAGHPVNLGMACPKGWEALVPLAAADRGTTPLIRGGDGALRPVGWDEAIRTLVVRFRELLTRHGPESVAFLSTGQMPTEEMALLGALFKFGMGAVHGDSNTRQCMATTHVAYKQSFGFDAPPYTYTDFSSSDVLVFLGANLCVAHPIMWQHVLRNPHRPQIIVIDPRRTETAAAATQHLGLRPKSDLTLLYGVANLLIQNGWIDEAYVADHTNGFAEFAEFVRDFTPDHVAAETGLTVGELFRFAETIHRGQAVSFWWTMGVNQGHESTRTAQAVINLALLTGNIGRPGTGANSITGQCNAMGSRLFANTSGLFGGRDFSVPADRATVADLLNVPVERIPGQTSLAYDQILDAVADGRIRGLWVIATNPAHSWIDQLRGTGALERLEFLVVQDLYPTTETARMADLYLPAAGWGEKEGTFINSERRLGVIRNVSPAPGLALSDFNIFRLVAEYWGCGELFRKWSSPAAVFQLLKRLSAGQPCDFTGIRDYDHLDGCGGIQWPCPADGPIPVAGESPAPGRRLFEDGRFFTPDGRARFIFEAPRKPGESINDEFPFVLLTGRGTSAQWHTNTRTGKSPVLRTLYPAEPYVEINPGDAARLGLRAQQSVTVVSRRGRCECVVCLTTAVAPGQLFVPMHYLGTNQLTFAEFDPYSRQPSYKYAAVRLEVSPPVRSPLP